MFSRLAQNPKKSKLTAACTAEVEKPIHTMEKLYSMEEKITAFLLPTLAISHPAKASEMKNPSGSANKIVPREEALSFRSDCMVGMREAQVAKQSPCIKKNALTLLRLACREIGECKMLPSLDRPVALLIKSSLRLTMSVSFLILIAIILAIICNKCIAYAIILQHFSHLRLKI